MEWGILGHQWAVKILARHVSQCEVRHAYLITGPRGVGRRTLAFRFAQALNCNDPLEPGKPCLKCTPCVSISSMVHPDLSVIKAEGASGTIKVEQVRELQHSLSLSPYISTYRVALLLNFEDANLSAGNALLKTLEDPPSKVVLILTAESSERLLPTIVSRCEFLRLRLLPIDELTQGMHSAWGLPLDKAQLFANISGGRPGYAWRLQHEPDLLSQRQIWLTDMIRMLSASRVERFSYAESISKDRETLREILLVWSSFWHDMLTRVAGRSIHSTNYDLLIEIENLAAHLDRKQVRQLFAEMQRMIGLLDTNINPRLALEVLMLKIPHL